MTGLPSRHSAGWPASSGPSSVHALASTHRHLPHFPHSTVSTTRPRATSRSRSTSFRRDAIPKPSFWHCARYTAKRFPSTARTVHLTLSPAFGGFIRARELHCSVFPDASRAARGTRAPQGAAARSLWEEKGAKRQRARGANGLPRPPPSPPPACCPPQIRHRERQRCLSSRPSPCGSDNTDRGCPAGSRLGGRAGSGLASLWKVLTGTWRRVVSRPHLPLVVAGWRGQARCWRLPGQHGASGAPVTPTPRRARRRLLPGNGGTAPPHAAPGSPLPPASHRFATTPSGLRRPVPGCGESLSPVRAPGRAGQPNRLPLKNQPSRWQPGGGWGRCVESAEPERAGALLLAAASAWWGTKGARPPPERVSRPGPARLGSAAVGRAGPGARRGPGNRLPGGRGGGERGRVRGQASAPAPSPFAAAGAEGGCALRGRSRRGEGLPRPGSGGFVWVGGLQQPAGSCSGCRAGVLGPPRGLTGVGSAVLPCSTGRGRPRGTPPAAGGVFVAGGWGGNSGAGAALGPRTPGPASVQAPLGLHERSRVEEFVRVQKPSALLIRNFKRRSGFCCRFGGVTWRERPEKILLCYSAFSLHADGLVAKKVKCARIPWPRMVLLLCLVIIYFFCTV